MYLPVTIPVTDTNVAGEGGLLPPESDAEGEAREPHGGEHEAEPQRCATGWVARLAWCRGRLKASLGHADRSSTPVVRRAPRAIGYKTLFERLRDALDAAA